MQASEGIKRVAAVTGGSSGIGFETAKLLLEKGYTVYCLSRTPPANERIHFIQTDVTNEQQVAAAFEAIDAARGRLDVLVSNAGMGVSGPIESTSLADARRQLEVNVLGMHAAVRHAIPLLRKTGGGAIVVTSSVAAVFALPFQGFYSASKFALNALTLALRAELKRFHIRVAAVMPGDVKTGFTDARVKDSGAQLYGADVDASLAVMERDERRGMDPARIARKIVAVAQAKNPKPLSSVGFPYQLFCLLGKILPIRLQSYLVSKIYIKKAS